MMSTTTKQDDINLTTSQCETARRIVHELSRVYKWENPLRSGTLFVTLIGFFIVTQHCSLLQIICGILMLATSINLVYVTMIQFSQKVISDHPTAHHPYNHLLNHSSALLSKDSAAYYSSVLVDIAEIIIRWIARIILIEDKKKSIKWLGLFFIIWKISAYISSRVILLTFLISLFIFPKLYMSNKDIVDARFQQCRALLNAQLYCVQHFVCVQLDSIKKLVKTYIAKNSTTATTPVTDNNNTIVDNDKITSDTTVNSTTNLTNKKDE
ncbi:Reticulon-domain-containing protein [Cokeromyces recurvatus]|uniref:Reticulon-domain-containing protein n=1 Tax=Cokeromyces recurvatus TaxID=90255 RepID=UPI0022200F35|nr:Reticulon-domain-containing protein [Cokeromyces recurvatus]KAI7904479.1 Reticulon-domain-containing protein [Cokeromyces recurvatus]